MPFTSNHLQQPPEPFWQQVPGSEAFNVQTGSRTALNMSHNAHSTMHLGAAAGSTVIDTCGTPSGTPCDDDNREAVAGNLGPDHRNKSAGECSVDVYNGDTFVRKVDAEMLARFSRTASSQLKRWNSKTAASTAMAKKLVLRVDAPQNPTHVAIETALKWMRDNQTEPHDQKLLDFGPSNLERVKLIDLLDLYQAVLAFELRPYPTRLKKEIMNRISERAPTLDIIEDFAAYIPVRDNIMTRLVTSHHDWYTWCYYTDDEAEQIDAFVRSRPDLGLRFDEIFHYRACRGPNQTFAQKAIWVRRQRHRATGASKREWSTCVRVCTEEIRLDPLLDSNIATCNSPGEINPSQRSEEQEIINSTTKRRRKRRLQQAKHGANSA